MSPELALARTLELAKKSWGKVSPNPPVGCVILDKDYNFLSEGYHKSFGGPHAEIEALQALPEGSDLTGAHFFVSLEPCAHQGKTGSCAKTLSQLPIASVTVGCKDPNSLVAGKGIKILEAAGIKVHWADEPKAFLQLIEIFNFNMTQKSCYVALKVATSLDGQMALKNGESQWITGEESRHYSHILRSKYDAVLVGRQTVESDQPRLNVRGLSEEINNKVVILDPQGRLSSKIKDYSLFKIRKPEDVILVVDQKLNLKSEAHLLPVSIEAGEIDLKELRKKLYGLGVYSVFCEGGAKTLSTFLKFQEFNKVYNFLAPQLIGAQNGLAWTKDLSIESLNKAIGLEISSVSRQGQDLLVESYLKV